MASRLSPLAGQYLRGASLVAKMTYYVEVGSFDECWEWQGSRTMSPQMASEPVASAGLTLLHAISLATLLNDPLSPLGCGQRERKRRSCLTT